MSSPLIPVILSGGAGTRLWPASRRSNPKQLQALVGDATLLQATVQRLAGLGQLADAPIVVASEMHADAIEKQLASIDSRGQLILEPIGRNTAPAIALAAGAMREQGRGQDVLLVMPADHVIADPATFCEHIRAGIGEASAGAMVTFGIVPNEAHTGYGYIRAGSADGAVRDVSEFVEKPDAETAAAYVASGEYFWNSGIFMFTADQFFAELSQHAPDIATDIEKSLAAASTNAGVLVPNVDLFAAVRAESIDYAVMEHTQRARVIPVDIGWSDVGSWPALHAALDSDAAGNSVRGQVLLDDVTQSLVRAESRLVAVSGLDNIVVVETADAVLVTHKDKAEAVKAFVNQLNDTGRDDLT